MDIVFNIEIVMLIVGLYRLVFCVIIRGIYAYMMNRDEQNFNFMDIVFYS